MRCGEAVGVLERGRCKFTGLRTLFSFYSKVVQDRGTAKYDSWLKREVINTQSTV